VRAQLWQAATARVERALRGRVAQAREQRRLSSAQARGNAGVGATRAGQALARGRGADAGLAAGGARAAQARASVGGAVTRAGAAGGGAGAWTRERLAVQARGADAGGAAAVAWQRASRIRAV
jgi:hypothetical protein